MPGRQKPAHQKPAKPIRPDRNVNGAGRDDLVRARRAVCTMLRCWLVCGHKQCQRTRACALASNDCFDRFWPLVPEQVKLCIRTGMEAGAAGCSRPEIVAAIMREQARWRDIQSPPETASLAPKAAQVAEAASVPPLRVAAPARATPRARVL